MPDNTPQDLFRACLLSGATGDALGAPVEFLTLTEITHRFGPRGIRDYAPAYGRLGAITDDTQMTLFTAEGLLRAHVRGCMRGITSFSGVTHHAYRRWLETQGERAPQIGGQEFGQEIGHDGWLWQVQALHARRGPGNTCLSALRIAQPLGDPAVNDSKGRGGVMRAAPVGLYAWHNRHDPDIATATFDTAVEIAALTHGHPDGQAPAGALALLVLRLVEGVPLPEAVDEVMALLRDRSWPGSTLAAITRAVDLAHRGGEPSAAAVESLGAGWVGEEALAIAIYCALAAPDLEQALILAVNHGGDSDSTGSITGNLLGASLGTGAIPARWLEPLELREEITAMADDLWECGGWDLDWVAQGRDEERVWERYPGW